MKYTTKDLMTIYDTIEIKSCKEVDSMREKVLGIDTADYNKMDLPLQEAYVVIDDYSLSAHYYSLKEGTISFDLYITDTPNAPLNERTWTRLFKCDAELRTAKILNLELVAKPKGSAKILMDIEAKDRTCEKMLVIICTIIMFMAVYKVEATATKSINRIDKKALERKYKYSHKIPLTTKRYSLNRDSHGTHVITCPAWEVRGYYRHYKSGKVIWVDGYTKGVKRREIQPNKRHYTA